MGMFQVTLTGEALKLFIGETVGGAKIVEIKDVSPTLLTSRELAAKYNMSDETVRKRLADFNKGTTGKHLYDPHEAHVILTSKPVATRGRKRKQ